MKSLKRGQPKPFRPWLPTVFSCVFVAGLATVGIEVLGYEDISLTPTVAKYLVWTGAFLAYGAGLGFGLLHLSRFFAYYDQELLPYAHFPKRLYKPEIRGPLGRSLRRRFGWASTLPFFTSVIVVGVTQRPLAMLLALASACWYAALLVFKGDLAFFLWVRRRGLHRPSEEAKNHEEQDDSLTDEEAAD